MSRRSSENTRQIALKIPEAWLSRVDAMVPIMCRPGVLVTRTDVIRAAIARGLDALETEGRFDDADPDGPDDLGDRSATDGEA